jgi:hypothetical protein
MMRGLRVFCLFLAATTWSLFAQTNQPVYTDSLQNGWENFGWTRIDYAATNLFHGGSRSISVTITQQWQAIYFHHAAQDSSGFTNLNFWINGGTNGGQRLQVQAQTNGVPLMAVSLGTLNTNTWQQFTLSLLSLGVTNSLNFDGFWIQDRVGAAQPTFYLDDITLIGGVPIVVTNPPPATNGPMNITVNVQSNRHAISDLIYGVAFASSNQLKELNAPLNRSGGNPESRYNWALNAHNRAFDFYFESIGDSPATAGAAGDDHVQASRNGGAEPMLTIPMLDWMPKLGAGRAKLASYATNKYGRQTDQDFTYFPIAGNGISITNNTPITWNDPNDANFLTNSLHQQGWLQHLTNRWGRSTNGGVRYYCMDNEHSIWHSTHRDVHPVGASMREVRDKFFDYAAKVKAVDPNARVAAPEEWGWSGFLYSGYDQQWSGKNNDYNPAHFPDRGTNGGWDYLPWFLDQARQRATNTGQRLLDIFSVHFYPQGGEFLGDTSPAMQARRNRSTRALWDTNYTDETWINAKVQLIPRLKQWVATYYPGLQTGITEYNWGAENHMNGATAQADILGIFGREGLDLATRWTTPATSTPTYKAMKLFRNYDDNKSAFGDTSVSATTLNADLVSAFAAQRSSDGSLTLIMINKTNAVSPVVLDIRNFSPSGMAQRWVLETNAITRRSDVTLTTNVFNVILPPQSVSLWVFPPTAASRLRANGLTSTNTFTASLTAPVGQRFVIEGATNLAQTNWIPLLTNIMAGTNDFLNLPASISQRYYRARWLP